MQIFLSVAEASADRHAAALVRAARQRGEAWRFSGLTGPRLRAEGVETVCDLVQHAAMLTGVVGAWRRGLDALRAAERAWQRERPDVVVVLDSWVFHQHLAAAARRCGIPVLYYIAPQLWASRPWRARRLARIADRVACILPFEEAFFRECGVQADFVGHPSFESSGWEEAAPQPHTAGEPTRPLIALLPGSRRQVIDALLPRQLEVVRRLRRRGLAVQAAVSCSSPDRLEQLRGHLARSGESCEIVSGDPAGLVRSADLVLVASGTAVLEVARSLRPMIVMYDAGGVLAGPHRWLGRFVLTTPHLSLVNILAGKRVTPEFMPFIPEVESVAAVARQLLLDQPWRQLMIRQLAETLAPLMNSQASQRVCELLRALAGEPSRPAV